MIPAVGDMFVVADHHACFDDAYVLHTWLVACNDVARAQYQPAPGTGVYMAV
jgi:hypothetical protein